MDTPNPNEAGKRPWNPLDDADPERIAGELKSLALGAEESPWHEELADLMRDAAGLFGDAANIWSAFDDECKDAAIAAGDGLAFDASLADIDAWQALWPEVIEDARAIYFEVRDSSRHGAHAWDAAEFDLTQVTRTPWRVRKRPELVRAMAAICCAYHAAERLLEFARVVEDRVTLGGEWANGLKVMRSLARESESDSESDSESEARRVVRREARRDLRNHIKEALQEIGNGADTFADSRKLIENARAHLVNAENEVRTRELEDIHREQISDMSAAAEVRTHELTSLQAEVSGLVPEADIGRRVRDGGRKSVPALNKKRTEQAGITRAKVLALWQSSILPERDRAGDIARRLGVTAKTVSNHETALIATGDLPARLRRKSNGGGAKKQR
ncbi:MAG: hypothetical protein RR101_14860 [Burkholderiaceae bacterium]